MMTGAVCPVTAAVAATGVGGAAWAAIKCEQKPDVVRFASVSSLIFAAQMVNFPISHGTSGHLLGGVLAATLLGTPFGVLAIALVLAVQSLLFSDGGISVLGANVVNMSLIGTGIGGLIAGRIRKRSFLSMARLGFASWLSIQLAALACSVELAVAGTVPLGTCAPAMLGTHAMIGIGEALITLLAFSLLPSAETNSRRSAFVPALAAMMIALLLSPFACGFPDGLEWVSEKLGFLHSAAPAFVAPLADYSLPGFSGALSTGLAGLAGVLVVFVLGSAVSLVWNSPRLCRTA